MLQNVVVNDEINGVSALTIEDDDNITELSKPSNGATTDNTNKRFNIVRKTKSLNGNHSETKRHNQVVDNKAFTAKLNTYITMQKHFATTANRLAESYEAVKKFQTYNNISTNEINIDLHSMVNITFYSVKWHNVKLL